MRNRDESTATWKPWALAGVVAAGSVVLLVVNARHYLRFFADDGFISLRYSRHLLAGQGLVWNAGERVEGYSNLLWVLLCAAAGLVERDLVAAARGVGLFASGLGLCALVYAARPRSLAEAAGAAAPALALACAGPVVVWAVGGLEQPLIVALLGWGLVLSYPLLDGEPATGRRVVPPSLCLALLCWARPDVALFPVLVCAALLLLRRPRAAARLAIGPALAVASQLAFRLAYYHEWVPNSALAKVAFTRERLRDGWAYLRAAGWPLAPLWIAALGAIVIGLTRGGRQARGRLLVLGLCASVWLAYIAVVGGDIFPARRHLVPVVVIAGLMFAQGVRPAGAARSGALLFALGLALAQRRDPENLRAVQERWEWDGLPVARLLVQGFGARSPRIAVDASGSLPFFSDLPAVDMLGINDRYLAHHPPPGFGKGYLGHELGDGAYVLSRKPDLVFFWTPRGDDHGQFLSGRQMDQDASFRLGYQLVTLEATQPFEVRSRVFVRREGAIGIERRPGEVAVPGFLFAQGAPVVARLDGQGRLAAAIPPGGRSVLGLRLPAGPWQARLSGTGGPAHAELRSTDEQVIAVEVRAIGQELAFVQQIVLTSRPPNSR